MNGEAPNDLGFFHAYSSEQFRAHTLGLFQAPSLCKAPNQINTPDNNFVDVAKNFVAEIIVSEGNISHG
jgi:hypothetical protein